MATRYIKRLILLAAKRFRVATFRLILRLNVSGSFFNELKRLFVTYLFVVVPTDKAVLTHHHCFHLGVFFRNLLHG